MNDWHGKFNSFVRQLVNFDDKAAFQRLIAVVDGQQSSAARAQSSAAPAQSSGGLPTIPTS